MLKQKQQCLPTYPFIRVSTLQSTVPSKWPLKQTRTLSAPFRDFAGFSQPTDRQTDTTSLIINRMVIIIDTACSMWNMNWFLNNSPNNSVCGNSWRYNWQWTNFSPSTGLFFLHFHLHCGLLIWSGQVAEKSEPYRKTMFFGEKEFSCFKGLNRTNPLFRQYDV